MVVIERVISLIEKLPFEQRIKMLGLDALWSELGKWRMVADTATDQEFVRITRNVILMIVQAFAFEIDAQDLIINDLRQEIKRLSSPRQCGDKVHTQRAEETLNNKTLNSS